MKTLRLWKELVFYLISLGDEHQILKIGGEDGEHKPVEAIQPVKEMGDTAQPVQIKGESVPGTSISPDWRPKPILEWIFWDDLNISDPAEDLSPLPETTELSQWEDGEEREREQLAECIQKTTPKGIGKHRGFLLIVIIEEHAKDSEESPSKSFVSY